MRRRGFSLIEVLMGVAISAVLIGVVYGVFYFFFFSKSRSNVTGLTRRSFIQKDAKAGVRRLTYRLREGTQVLSPAPGTTAAELVFRDITNTDVRVRRLPAENKVISERMVGGAWQREVDPVVVDTGTAKLPISFPVQVLNCQEIRFTVLSGASVVVEASIENEGTLGSLLTVVKLRNAQKSN